MVIQLFTHIAYVIVFTHNMDSTLDFWKNKIGLPVRYAGDVWSELELKNTILALHKNTDASPRDTGIVFEVKDIQETVRELRQKGIEVTEPEDIGTGLEALFKDPEGNTFHIYQPAKQE